MDHSDIWNRWVRRQNMYGSGTEATQRSHERSTQFWYRLDRSNHQRLNIHEHNPPHPDSLQDKSISIIRNELSKLGAIKWEWKTQLDTKALLQEIADDPMPWSFINNSSYSLATRNVWNSPDNSIGEYDKYYPSIRKWCLEQPEIMHPVIIDISSLAPGGNISPHSHSEARLPPKLEGYPPYSDNPKVFKFIGKPGTGLDIMNMCVTWNENCRFGLMGYGELKYDPHDTYWLNTSAEHCVINRGQSERIHLVMQFAYKRDTMRAKMLDVYTKLWSENG